MTTFRCSAHLILAKNAWKRSRRSWLLMSGRSVSERTPPPHDGNARARWVSKASCRSGLGRFIAMASAARLKFKNPDAPGSAEHSISGSVTRDAREIPSQSTDDVTTASVGHVRQRWTRSGADPKRGQAARTLFPSVGDLGVDDPIPLICRGRRSHAFATLPDRTNLCTIQTTIMIQSASVCLFKLTATL